MTFGEKLKKARTEAGCTQEEAAAILNVSRAAVAKWESGRGLPDIENLKAISETFGVSIDHLLDDTGKLDLKVTKTAIDLGRFGDKGRMSRLRKLEIKEKIVRENYQSAEIVRLTVTGTRSSRSENAADVAVGMFALLAGGIPMFGTQRLGRTLNSLDQQYYLVNEEKAQYLVLLTDEYMISRKLEVEVNDKKFETEGIRFLTAGNVE